MPPNIKLTLKDAKNKWADPVVSADW
jgi:hypothetical protein